MIKDSITNAFSRLYPTVLILVIIICSIRIAYLIKNNQKFVLYKELISLGFILYLLFLYNIVTYQDVYSTTGASNFTPFREILRYKFGSELFFKNVVGNIVIFIPFGYFVSYYLKPKKIGLVCILTLIATSTIEFTQLSIGRVFDIDDIILNLLGGILGCIIYIALCATKNIVPSFFYKDICLSIYVVLITALLCFYFHSIGIRLW